MRKAATNLEGTRLEVGGDLLHLPPWRSAHRLPGQSNWWNPAGVVNGYYTNLAPDDAPIMLPDAPGARAVLYEDTGLEECTISCVWTGAHDAGTIGGPIACVNPDAPEFSLCFVYEFGIFGGTWACWHLGRQPDDIELIVPDAIKNEPTGHVSGVPVELSIQIVGNQAICRADGVEKINYTIPVSLRGSTIHGVLIDVNGSRQPNEPVLVAPYTITS